MMLCGKSKKDDLTVFELWDRYKFVAKTHTLACGMKATFHLTYT